MLAANHLHHAFLRSSMRTVLRQARHHVHADITAHHASIPAFLCPALLRGPLTHPPTSIQLQYRAPPSKTFSTFRRNQQQISAAVHDVLDSSNLEPDPESPSDPSQVLPRTCPGCGAPTQVFETNEAGYYNIDRRQVRDFLHFEPAEKKDRGAEDDVYAKSLEQMDPKILEELGLDQETLNASQQSNAAPPETPVCDRCHNLVHHNIGNPIFHPSVEAIKETIAESPHRRNHVYHVVDAADFPLSLVPNLQTALRLPKLRTQNRRAKHKGWVANNRIAEVSFIVTRADLLAPLKEQVDKLLPYVQNVLRAALGRVNKTARLGNVHLVSAKRGWWTKKVKEDIWERGGAGWMVGKVNVGKSNLFETVFPKGRGADYEDIRKIRSAKEREVMLSKAKTMDETSRLQEEFEQEDEVVKRRKSRILEPATDPERFPEEDEDLDDLNSLLPPRQPYTPFPVLPVASSLPGTTASPIRIPFGRNRGELIDLPGLARTSPELTTFVKPQHQAELLMIHRVTAQRHVLHPGKSLVLGGGLIRLTPKDPDLVFLVYPFVPLTPHITSTEKAITLQDQTRESGVPSILSPSAGPQIKSAGTFKLKWDATKQLAGPLTSATAGKMKPENLPFQIWSTDILIEGVGWVEISCQTRRKQGWKPVGMAKKDPNHARNAKLLARQQEQRRKDEKWAARSGTSNTPLLEGGGGGGDAFDRAGLGIPSSSSPVATTKQQPHRNDAFDAYPPEQQDEYEEPNESDPWDTDFHPSIEVFSPLGKYIGARMPMCGSVLGGPKPVSSRERTARPRRSMVSVKKQRRPGGGVSQSG